MSMWKRMRTGDLYRLDGWEDADNLRFIVALEAEESDEETPEGGWAPVRPRRVVVVGIPPATTRPLDERDIRDAGRAAVAFATNEHEHEQCHA